MAGLNKYDRILKRTLCATMGLVLGLGSTKICWANIIVHPSEVHIGRVQPGSVPVRFIEIANQGTDTITITHVETSDNLHVVATVIGDRQIHVNDRRKVRVAIYDAKDSNEAYTRIELSSGDVYTVPIKWHSKRLQESASDLNVGLDVVDEELSTRVLSISPKVMDLGIINKKTTMPCRFRISNIAKEDIFLTRAYSSCGCTVVDFKPQALPAGKTLEIEYYLDAAEKFHHFKVPVMIEARLDDKRLRSSGSITGFTEVYYEFHPKKLSFSDLEQSQQPSNSEIVIKSLSDRVISVASIAADNGYVSLNTAESPDLIRVKCVPLLSELVWGIWEDTIRIELNLSGTTKEVISVPVTIEKGGNLKITPARVFYGFVRLGKDYSRSLTVQSRKGTINEISFLGKPEQLDVSVVISQVTKAEYKIDCSLRQMTAFTNKAIRDELCFLINGEEYHIPAYAILMTE